MSNIFHKHLDKCEHCRDNPFNLCETGQTALAFAGNETVNMMSSSREEIQEYLEGRGFAVYDHENTEDLRITAILDMGIRATETGYEQA